MAITVGNHVSATAAASLSVTSAGIAVTAGSLLVVGTSAFATSNANENAATAITDSVGDSFVAIGSSLLTANRYCSMFYAKNVAGGASVTFTYTLTQSDYPRIFVLEVKGCDLTAPLDVSNLKSATGSTTITSTGIATAIADEILVAIGVDQETGAAESWADGGCATGTGAWTKIESIIDSSTVEGSLAYVIESATGTYCATMTSSAGNTMKGIGIASFKIASAAPQITPPLLLVPTQVRFIK